MNISGTNDRINSNFEDAEDIRIQLDSWKDSFIHFNKTIDSVCRETEYAFTKLGDQLQKYQTRAKQLSEHTKSSVDQISREILTDGVLRINEILRRFEIYLDDSNKRINNAKNELANILEHVDSVNDNTLEFKRLIKSLRMLGFSTKMESVRINLTDNSFEILANKVESLSDVIGEKIKFIKDKSNLALGQIRQAIVILESLGGQQLTQSKFIVENLNSAMKIFEVQSGICKDGTAEISEMSADIYANIARVVTSIQFHDITRQQLEHVKEAFAEIIEKHENMSSLAEQQIKKEFLGTVQNMQNVLGLQAAQIEHSEKELVSAVRDIKSSLENIRGNVHGIYDKAENLFDEKSSLGHKAFTKAGDDLDIVTSYLMKNAGLGNDLSESVKSVIIIIDELAKHIQDVEDIGSEIELIALNSSIKAAHTGSKGLALGVLAESIQKFSIDAKNQTKVTTDVLIEIEEISNSLKLKIIEQSNEKVQEELVDSNKQAGEILKKIDVHSELTKQNVKEIKKEVTTLGKDLSVTISDFDSGDELSRMMNGITSNLNELANFIKETFKIYPQYKDVNDLKKRYTMHSERDIHAKVSTDYQADLSKDNEQSDGDTEFGQNVELF